MDHSYVPYYEIVDRFHFVNLSNARRVFDENPWASIVIQNISSERKNVKHSYITSLEKAAVKGLQIKVVGDLVKNVPNRDKLN